MLQTKRAYEAPSKEDGYRILVDRLWPRGISKEKAHLNLWAKDIAPTTQLRREFAHQEDKFPWFKKEYLAELNHNLATDDFIKQVKIQLSKGNVTLIYAAKNTKANHAIILKEYLESRLK